MQGVENKEIITTRDSDLDIYRGFVMMYIVGFIHIAQFTLFNWHHNTAATFALIEMPIIFYISGAAYTLSRKKPYGKYVIGKLKRIFIPLLIFIPVYAVISWSCKSFITQETDMDFLTYFGNTLAGKYDTSHLWFIRPYLIIALLLPLLHHFSNYLNRYTIYIPLLVAIVILYFDPSYVLCYIVPAMAGLYYRRDKPYNSYIVLLIMLCGLIFCHYQGYGWNMQINKFPSNLMFLSYTSAVLIIIGKPMKWCCKRLAQIPFINYIVRQYARYDFSIYLYHLLVLSIIRHAYLIAGMHLTFLSHPALSYPLIAIATLLCMIPVGMCVDYANNKVMQMLSRSVVRKEKCCE